VSEIQAENIRMVVHDCLDEGSKLTASRRDKTL
jgi:hypothetical protein